MHIVTKKTYDYLVADGSMLYNICDVTYFFVVQEKTGKIKIEENVCTNHLYNIPC